MRVPGRTASATIEQTRRATSGPDGDVDGVDVGQVLEDLEGVCRDACDQVGLVRRVNVAESLGGGGFLGVESRVVELSSVKAHFGAERSHRRHLGGIGLFGDHHDRSNAEEASRPGDGLAVIPARRRDHASAPVLRPRAAT